MNENQGDEDIGKMKEELSGFTTDEEVTEKMVKPNSNSKQEKKNNNNRTREYFLQKYNGAEAILVEHKPFFLQIIGDKAVLSDRIVFPDMNINPPDRPAYLNKD